MVDVEIYTTSDKLSSFELSPIICEDPLGHTESEYDALQKLDCCILSDVYYWHCLHPLCEGVNNNEQESKTSWCPGQNTHDVDSLDCERPAEIDRPERICMLGSLLLEELAVFALGDNFNRVILGCGLVEPMPECLADDRAL
jgi:hypothetical protein